MGLSVWEKLLVAAFKLEEEGSKRFSAEDLVVSAWSLFPDTFGLAGHLDSGGSRKYPDSNRVFAEVMGSKPLRKRGYLEKTGSKMYGLTETGRELGRSLVSRSKSGITEKISLSRESVDETKRLLATRAYKKYVEGGIDSVTFYDGCMFWGITPHSRAVEFEGKTANVERVITDAVDAVGEGGAAFTHGQEDVSASDLDALLKLHRSMVEKFDTEIAVIKSRRDER